MNSAGEFAKRNGGVARLQLERTGREWRCSEGLLDFIDGSVEPGRCSAPRCWC